MYCRFLKAVGTFGLGLVAFSSCVFPEYDVSSAAGAGGTGEGGAGVSGAGTVAPVGGMADGQGGAGTDGGIATLGGEGGATSGGAGASGGSSSTAPVTCATLLAEDEMRLSGPFALDPDGSGPQPSFQAYCDMDHAGGGWTLLGSFLDTTFDVDNTGSGVKPCYDEACINRAYSTLVLGRDLLIEWSDLAISGEAIDGRGTFSRIDATLSGRTLRDTFLATTPTFVQAPATTVTLTWFNGKSCSTWPNWGAAVCQNGIQVVLQDPACGGAPPFHIGMGDSYTNVAGNCDGWPQTPGINFPHAYRFWTR